MSKIALSMITLGTEDDAQNLRRCLMSIAPYVDSIYVTITGPKNKIKDTEDVCKEFKVNISYHNPTWTVTKEAYEWLIGYLGYIPHVKIGEKLFLFDEARNYNFSQIPKEYKWIFWIDTDDILIDGENLWKLKEIGDQANVDGICLKYIYRSTLDKEGKVKEILIEHIKERMVLNSVFKWVGPIHENLVGFRQTTKTSLEDCVVLHLTDSIHIKRSTDRNTKNLEFALYQTKGEDPRYTYFLAKAYLDRRTSEYNDKAFPLIQNFLWGEYKSTWPEERAQAYEYLSDIYRQRGQFNNAIKSCVQALDEEPRRKSIYLNIALAYIDKGEWDKALFWVHLADRISDKDTSLNVNPRDSKVIKLAAVYTASLNKGKTYDAYEAALELIKILPNDPAIKTSYDFISKQKDQRDIATVISGLVAHLKSAGETDKIITLLASIPTVAKDDPMIGQIKKEFLVQI